MGSMISRSQKELAKTEIEKIAETYHNWRSKEWETEYKDVPGFCKSADIETIRKNNYVLTPVRYIDFKEAEGDGHVFDDRMNSFIETLKQQMQKAEDLDEAIKDNLQRIGYNL